MSRTGPPAPAGPPVERDHARLRSVLGMFASGITVVTAGGAVPCGMTANAFTSVSLRPPLILVCVLRQAAMNAAIQECGAFAISVLSARQERVARYFADHNRPRGPREFDAVDTRPGPCTRAPIVTGATAWLECGLAAVYDGGDHTIFLGSVLGTGHGSPRDALIFFGGDFHRFDPGGI